MQRDRFLSLFRIDRATLPRLTDSDIAMLASHNIDSADDVLRENNQLERLVGIWNARELDAWASAQEKKFAFDATRSLDPDDVREVDQLIQAQQEQLLAELEKGEKDLRLLVREMESRRESVRRESRTVRTHTPTEGRVTGQAVALHVTGRASLQSLPRGASVLQQPLRLRVVERRVQPALRRQS